MADLNALLTDWKDKRLAYKEVNRAAHEALLDGIVAEIEALKAYAVPRLPLEPFEDAVGLPKDAVDKIVADAAAEHAVAAKRGPGRPPKAEAA